MLDFFDFRGDRGCLGIALRIGLFVYAILSIATDTDTLFSWSILLGEILAMLVYILYRWVINRKNKQANSCESNKESIPQKEKRSESIQTFGKNEIV